MFDFSALIGLIGFAVMLLMVVFGVPIFVAMLLPAMAGIWLIGGSNFALIQLTTGPYNITAQYSWAILPLFLLMGVLAADSGMAEGAYTAIAKWVPNVRGSILMVTVGANAMFGAVSGSPPAAAIIFAKLALPEVEKFGYDKKLSLATMAAAGILVVLIPPSTGTIVLAILTNISIGKALIAGIIPGIITMFVFCLTIWVWGIIHPKRLPLVNLKESWRAKFSSLKLVWPIMALFLLLVGGLYLGVYPPTIAGAIGASGVLIYAIVRRVKGRTLLASFKESVLLNGQLFILMIAGFMFSRFIALSGLAGTFNNVIVETSIPPLAVMALVMVFYIFAGIVGEVFPMLIVTLPVVFPLLTSLGFDPYMLCIVLILLMAIGGLTPPLGMPVFIIASIAKVDPMEVFKGIWPFFWAELALCWIFVLIPETCTWLPSLAYQ